MDPKMNHSAISGPADLKNRNVTVMGLGRFGGGIEVVRYLVNQGARVTVTDHLPEQQLTQSLQEIAELPLQNVFCGEHPAEAFECDLLVVNPAVKPDHPALQRCVTAGIPVVTEIQLLLLHLRTIGVQLRNSEYDSQLPADVPHVTVIAVTGTNGKSTTASLIHHLLNTHFATDFAAKRSEGNDSVQQGQSGSERKCWLGGNIGGSLLSVVHQIQLADVVVLELSSFQLHHLGNFNFAADIAVLTGFSPNHLDWHPSLEHYHAAKQNLFRRQLRQHTAVIPAAHITNGPRTFSADHDEEDQPTWRIRCQELRFGVIDDGQDGVFWDENSLVVRRQGIEDAVRLSLPASLSGKHNLLNFTAAACAAIQLGADPFLFQKSVMKFPGLPFRLCLSGQTSTVQFINDSASTTPESTIAAVQTLRNRPGLRQRSSMRSSMSEATDEAVQRLVVIAGGADKGSDLSNMVTELQQHADAVVAIGNVAATLKEAILNESENGCQIVQVATDFESAIRQAVELVAPCGIVLLSPGCSSFGWFQNYVDRGQQFDLLVEQWISK